MNFLFAWRYFKSKKTTNAINIIAWVSVIAIAVVTAAIIIVLSVANGLEALVKSLYTDFYADIKISAANGKIIAPTTQQLKGLLQINTVAYYTTIVEEKAVLLNDSYQSIVILKAIDSNYNKVNKISNYIKRGSFNVGNAEHPQIVVGAGIENAVNVDVQAAINPLLLYLPNRKRTNTVTSLDAFNSATIQPVGAFLIQQDFDNKYAFTNIGFAKYMLDYGENDCTSIEIKLKQNASPEVAKNQLKQYFGTNYVVATRYEQNASLFRIMQVEKWFIYAFLSFILIIASFNIVGALTMLVLEKQKDIAILKAMGGNNALIQKIFLAEGMLLAFIGGTLGIIIAAVICWLQQKFHIIKLQGGTFVVDYYPVQMQPLDFLLTVVTIAIIAFVAAYFPSKKAAMQQVALK